MRRFQEYSFLGQQARMKIPLKLTEKYAVAVAPIVCSRQAKCVVASQHVGLWAIMLSCNKLSVCDNYDNDNNNNNNNNNKCGTDGTTQIPWRSGKLSVWDVTVTTADSYVATAARGRG